LHKLAIQEQATSFSYLTCEEAKAKEQKKDKREKMKGISSFKRLISLIVVVCFLTTNAMAMPAQELGISRTAYGEQKLFHFDIPHDLGSVVETYTAKTQPGTPYSVPRTVIYIQDAHDSLEAQEHIADMVRHFVKEYGVKTVYEEGYEGPVPTDELFGEIKDPELKEKVSYYLMDKLRVGGAEYAHINRQTDRDSSLVPRPSKSEEPQQVPSPESRGTDFELMGADSIATHLENIRAYEQAGKNRAGVTKDVQRIRKELQRLIDKNFSKEIKEWLKLQERYQNGQLPLVQYLERTWKIRGTWNVERGTQTGKKNEKTFPVSRSPFPGVEALLSGDEKKIRKIVPATLLQEIKQLETEIVDRGLPAERDQKTYGYYQSCLLLEKLNGIQLSAEEFQDLKVMLEGLKTADVARFIAKEKHRSIVLFRSWEDLITDSVNFYELAKKRDASIAGIFDKFLQNPEERTAALVFGGFHKEAIKRILKEKGISYVILSPSIRNPSKRHEDYYRMLMSGGMHSFERMPGLGTRDSSLVKTSLESRATSPEERGESIARESTRTRPAVAMNYGPTLDLLAETAAQFRSKTQNDFILAMDERFTRKIPGYKPQTTAQAEIRSETRMDDEGAQFIVDFINKHLEGRNDPVAEKMLELGTGPDIRFLKYFRKKGLNYTAVDRWVHPEFEKDVKKAGILPYLGSLPAASLDIVLARNILMWGYEDKWTNWVSNLAIFLCTLEIIFFSSEVLYKKIWPLAQGFYLRRLMKVYGKLRKVLKPGGIIVEQEHGGFTGVPNAVLEKMGFRLVGENREHGIRILQLSKSNPVRSEVRTGELPEEPDWKEPDLLRRAFFAYEYFLQLKDWTKNFSLLKKNIYIGNGDILGTKTALGVFASHLLANREEVISGNLELFFNGLEIQPQDMKAIAEALAEVRRTFLKNSEALRMILEDDFKPYKGILNQSKGTESDPVPYDGQFSYLLNAAFNSDLAGPGNDYEKFKQGILKMLDVWPLVDRSVQEYLDAETARMKKSSVLRSKAQFSERGEASPLSNIISPVKTEEPEKVKGSELARSIDGMAERIFRNRKKSVTRPLSEEEKSISVHFKGQKIATLYLEESESGEILGQRTETTLPDFKASKKYWLRDEIITAKSKPPGRGIVVEEIPPFNWLTQRKDRLIEAGKFAFWGVAAMAAFFALLILAERWAFGPDIFKKTGPKQSLPVIEKTETVTAPPRSEVRRQSGEEIFRKFYMEMGFYKDGIAWPDAKIAPWIFSKVETIVHGAGNDFKAVLDEEKKQIINVEESHYSEAEFGRDGHGSQRPEIRGQSGEEIRHSKNMNRSETRAKDPVLVWSQERIKELLAGASQVARVQVEQVLTGTVFENRETILKPLKKALRYTGKRSSEDQAAIARKTSRLIHWSGGIGLVGENADAWFDQEEPFLGNIFWNPIQVTEPLMRIFLGKASASFLKWLDAQAKIRGISTRALAALILTDIRFVQILTISNFVKKYDRSFPGMPVMVAADSGKAERVAHDLGDLLRKATDLSQLSPGSLTRLGTFFSGFFNSPASKNIFLSQREASHQHGRAIALGEELLENIFSEDNYRYGVWNLAEVVVRETIYFANLGREEHDEFLFEEAFSWIKENFDLETLFMFPDVRSEIRTKMELLKPYVEDALGAWNRWEKQIRERKAKEISYGTEKQGAEIEWKLGDYYKKGIDLLVHRQWEEAYKTAEASIRLIQRHAYRYSDVTIDNVRRLYLWSFHFYKRPSMLSPAAFTLLERYAQTDSERLAVADLNYLLWQKSGALNEEEWYRQISFWHSLFQEDEVMKPELLKEQIRTWLIQINEPKEIEVDGQKRKIAFREEPARYIYEAFYHVFGGNPSRQPFEDANHRTGCIVLNYFLMHYLGLFDFKIFSTNYGKTTRPAARLLHSISQEGTFSSLYMENEFDRALQEVLTARAASQASSKRKGSRSELRGDSEEEFALEEELLRSTPQEPEEIRKVVLQRKQGIQGALEALKKRGPLTISIYIHDGATSSSYKGIAIPYGTIGRAKVIAESLLHYFPDAQVNFYVRDIFLERFPHGFNEVKGDNRHVQWIPVDKDKQQNTWPVDPKADLAVEVMLSNQARNEHLGDYGAVVVKAMPFQHAYRYFETSDVASNDLNAPRGTLILDGTLRDRKLAKDKWSESTLAQTRTLWLQANLSADQLDGLAQAAQGQWDTAQAVWTWAYVRNCGAFLQELKRLQTLFNTGKIDPELFQPQGRQVLIHLIGDYPMFEKNAWINGQILRDHGIDVISPSGNVFRSAEGSVKMPVTVMLHPSIEHDALMTLVSELSGTFTKVRKDGQEFWLDFPAYVTGGATWLESVSSMSIFRHDDNDVQRLKQPQLVSTLIKQKALHQPGNSWRHLEKNAEADVSRMLLGEEDQGYGDLRVWTLEARNYSRDMFENFNWTDDVALALARREQKRAELRGWRESNAVNDMVEKLIAGMPLELDKIFRKQSWPAERKRFDVGGNREIARAALSRIVNGTLTEYFGNLDSPVFYDVSAGEGWLGSILDPQWRRDGRYVAFDINPHFLERAKQRGIATKTILGNVYRLSQHIQNAEALISADAYDTFEELEKALAESYAALKPGGKLILFQTLRVGPQPFFLGSFAEEFKKTGYIFCPQLDAYFQNKEALRQVLRAYVRATVRGTGGESHMLAEDEAGREYFESRVRYEVPVNTEVFLPRMKTAMAAAGFKVLKAGKTEVGMFVPREPRHDQVMKESVHLQETGHVNVVEYKHGAVKLISSRDVPAGQVLEHAEILTFVAEKPSLAHVNKAQETSSGEPAADGSEVRSEIRGQPSVIEREADEKGRIGIARLKYPKKILSLGERYAGKTLRLYPYDEDWQKGTLIFDGDEPIAVYIIREDLFSVLEEQTTTDEKGRFIREGLRYNLGDQYAHIKITLKPFKTPDWKTGLRIFEGQAEIAYHDAKNNRTFNLVSVAPFRRSEIRGKATRIIMAVCGGVGAIGALAVVSSAFNSSRSEIRSKPKTVQIQGGRKEQEDRFVNTEIRLWVPGWVSVNGRLLAVMDGHGGALAANLLKWMLVPVFEFTLLLQKGNVEKAFQKTYRVLDKLTARVSSGSTLSAIFVPADKQAAYVMTVGDSPAFIFKDNELVFFPEHKISEFEELKEHQKLFTDRLDKDFNFLKEDGVYYLRDLKTRLGIAVTRAFGSRSFRHIMIQEPYVGKVDLTGTQSAIEILLATDGVYGPQGNLPKKQRDLPMEELLSRGANAQAFIERVRDVKSLDNVTVIRWTISPPRSEMRDADFARAVLTINLKDPLDVEALRYVQSRLMQVAAADGSFKSFETAVQAVTNRIGAGSDPADRSFLQGLAGSLLRPTVQGRFSPSDALLLETMKQLFAFTGQGQTSLRFPSAVQTINNIMPPVLSPVGEKLRVSDSFKQQQTELFLKLARTLESSDKAGAQRGEQGLIQTAIHTGLSHHFRSVLDSHENEFTPGTVRRIREILSAVDKTTGRRSEMRLPTGQMSVEVIEVPADAQFMVDVTDLTEDQARVKEGRGIQPGLHLERDSRLIEIVKTLVADMVTGNEKNLLPAATKAQAKLLEEAYENENPEERTPFFILRGKKQQPGVMPIPDSEWAYVNEIVNGLMTDDEKRISRGESVLMKEGLSGRGERYAVADWAHRLSLFLTRLLKDRDYLKFFAALFFTANLRWKTESVARNFVPHDVFVELRPLRGGLVGTEKISDHRAEAENLIGFFKGLGFKSRQVDVNERKEWAGDSKFWLPHQKGSSFYYVRPSAASPLRSHISEYPNALHERGASIPGIAKTPFVIFADTVDPVEREMLKEYLRQQISSYKDIEFYTLPSGWTTFAQGNRLHLLEVGHIDNVAGYVPAAFTERNENILLADPWYYEEIKDNKELQRFLQEQGVAVEFVEESERGFNPANFENASDELLVFNYAPQTIEKLKLKKGKYAMLPREKAILAVASQQGSLACLVIRTPVSEIQASGAEVKEKTEVPVEWKTGDRVRHIVSGREWEIDQIGKGRVHFKGDNPNSFTATSQLDKFYTHVQPPRAEIRNTGGINLRDAVRSVIDEEKWKDDIRVDIDEKIFITDELEGLNTVILELTKNAIDGSRIYKKLFGKGKIPDIQISAVQEGDDRVMLRVTNRGTLPLGKLREQAKKDGVWMLHPEQDPERWLYHYMTTSRMTEEPMPFVEMSDQQIDALSDDILLFRIKGLTLRSDENLKRIGMTKDDVTGGRGLGLKLAWSIMQKFPGGKPIRYESGMEEGEPTVTFLVELAPIRPGGMSRAEIRVPKARTWSKADVGAVVIAGTAFSVMALGLWLFRDGITYLVREMDEKIMDPVFLKKALTSVCGALVIAGGVGFALLTERIPKMAQWLIQKFGVHAEGMETYLKALSMFFSVSSLTDKSLKVFLGLLFIKHIHTGDALTSSYILAAFLFSGGVIRAISTGVYYAIKKDPHLRRVGWLCWIGGVGSLAPLLFIFGPKIISVVKNLVRDLLPQEQTTSDKTKSGERRSEIRQAVFEWDLHDIEGNFTALQHEWEEKGIPVLRKLPEAQTDKAYWEKELEERKAQGRNFINYRQPDLFEKRKNAEPVIALEPVSGADRIGTRRTFYYLTGKDETFWILGRQHGELVAEHRKTVSIDSSSPARYSARIIFGKASLTIESEYPSELSRVHPPEHKRYEYPYHEMNLPEGYLPKIRFYDDGQFELLLEPSVRSKLEALAITQFDLPATSTENPGARSEIRKRETSPGDGEGADFKPWESLTQKKKVRIEQLLKKRGTRGLWWKLAWDRLRQVSESENPEHPGYNMTLHLFLVAISVLMPSGMLITAFCVSWLPALLLASMSCLTAYSAWRTFGFQWKIYQRELRIAEKMVERKGNPLSAKAQDLSIEDHVEENDPPAEKKLTRKEILKGVFAVVLGLGTSITIGTVLLAVFMTLNPRLFLAIPVAASIYWAITVVASQIAYKILNHLRRQDVLAIIALAGCIGWLCCWRSAYEAAVFGMLGHNHATVVHGKSADYVVPPIYHGSLYERAGYGLHDQKASFLEAQGFYVEAEMVLSWTDRQMMKKFGIIPPQVGTATPDGLRIYDQTGRALYANQRLHVIDSFGDIPEGFKQDLFLHENRKWEEKLNPVIEWESMARVFWKKIWYPIRYGESYPGGGSTIGTQSAKNEYYGPTHSAKDKLRQMITAEMSIYNYGISWENVRRAKEEALIRYLNETYLGVMPGYGQVHGLAEAASVYFGMTPQELMSAENSILVGAIRSPLVIRASDENWRTTDDYWKRLRYEWKSKKLDPAARKFRTILLQKTGSILGEQGPELKGRDISVYTSFNGELQQYIQAVLTKMERRYHGQVDIGFLMADQTGRMRALGETGTDQFSFVLNGRYSMGSTAKLYWLLYYLDQIPGTSTEDTFMDEPLEIGKGRKAWRPKNADKTFSYQPMTVREAVYRSSNIIFVQVAQKCYAHTREKLIKQWETEGKTRIPSSAEVFEEIGKTFRRYGYEMPLKGGLTAVLGSSGDNLFQLVSCMQLLANDGVKMPIRFVDGVRLGPGSSFDTIMRRVETSEQIISPKTAAIVRQLLLGVVREGTAHGLVSVNDPEAEILIGGKTGTAQLSTAAAFVGILEMDGAIRPFGMTLIDKTGGKLKLSSAEVVRLLSEIMPGVSQILGNEPAGPAEEPIVAPPQGMPLSTGLAFWGTVIGGTIGVGVFLTLFRRSRQRSSVKDEKSHLAVDGRAEIREEDTGSESDFRNSVAAEAYIESVAGRMIEQKLAGILPKGAKILDLLSGRFSYIPDTAGAAEVVGIGLNNEELALNGKLTDHRAQDLNKQPDLLPEWDGRFDAVVITSGVAYSEDLERLFRSAAKVLRNGGSLFVAYNPDYYSKEATAFWKSMRPDGKVKSVTDAITAAGSFTVPQHERKSYAGMFDLSQNLEMIVAYKGAGVHSDAKKRSEIRKKVINLIRTISPEKWITRAGKHNFGGKITKTTNNEIVIEHAMDGRGWAGAPLPLPGEIVPSPEESKGTILHLGIKEVIGTAAKPGKYALTLQWQPLENDYYVRVYVDPGKIDTDKTGTFSINLSHLLWRHALPRGQYYFQVVVVGEKRTQVVLDKLELEIKPFVPDEKIPALDLISPQLKRGEPPSIRDTEIREIYQALGGGQNTIGDRALKQLGYGNELIISEDPFSLPPAVSDQTPTKDASRAEMREMRIAGQTYQLHEVPENSEWTALITDVRMRKVAPVAVGKDLDRTTRLFDYVRDLVIRYSKGDESKLLPAGSPQFCQLLKAAWTQPELWLKVEDFLQGTLQSISEEAELFLSKEERRLLALMQDPTDPMLLEKYRHAVAVHNYVVQLLLNLKMNRDFLAQAARSMEQELSAWKTAELRGTFIPTPLTILVELFQNGIGDTFLPESEIDRVVGLFEEAHVPYRRASQEETKQGWAKDFKLWLPPLPGHPHYFVTLKNVPGGMPGPEFLNVFDPSLREYFLKNSLDLSQGGSVVSGTAKTPFMVFSSDVGEEKIREFERQIKATLPVYHDMKIYVLPAGFTTYRYKSRTYRIANNHLDNVLGFIPHDANEYGRDLVMIDPFYDQEVKDLPAYQDLLKDQDLLPIEIDADEVQFNPANFGEPRPGFYIFNFCPRTLARLRLRPEHYKAIEDESRAVLNLPVMGGTTGCLIGREPMEIQSEPSRVTGAKPAKIVYTDSLEIPPLLDETIRRIVTTDFKDLIEGVDYDFKEGRSVYVNVRRLLGHPWIVNGRPLELVKLKGVAFDSGAPLKPFAGVFPLVIDFGPRGEILAQRRPDAKPTGAMTLDAVQNEFEATSVASRGRANVALPLGTSVYETARYEGKPLAVLILGLRQTSEQDLRSYFVNLIGHGKIFRESNEFGIFIEPGKAMANREKVIGFLRNVGAAYCHIHDLGLFNHMNHPGNILISGNGRIRISDFEFSRILRGLTRAQETAYRVNDLRAFMDSIDLHFAPALLEDLRKKFAIDIQKEFLAGYLGADADEKALSYAQGPLLNDVLALLTLRPDFFHENPLLITVSHRIDSRSEIRKAVTVSGEFKREISERISVLQESYQKTREGRKLAQGYQKIFSDIIKHIVATEGDLDKVAVFTYGSAGGRFMVSGSDTDLVIIPAAGISSEKIEGLKNAIQNGITAIADKRWKVNFKDWNDRYLLRLASRFPYGRFIDELRSTVFICGDEKLFNENLRNNSRVKILVEREDGLLGSIARADLYAKARAPGKPYDVKNSPGGLRDFQAIYRAGRILSQRLRFRSTSDLNEESLFKEGIIDHEEEKQLNVALDFFLTAKDIAKNSDDIASLEKKALIAKTWSISEGQVLRESSHHFQNVSAILSRLQNRIRKEYAGSEQFQARESQDLDQLRYWIDHWNTSICTTLILRPDLPIEIRQHLREKLPEIYPPDTKEGGQEFKELNGFLDWAEHQPRAEIREVGGINAAENPNRVQPVAKAELGQEPPKREQHAPKDTYTLASEQPQKGAGIYTPASLKEKAARSVHNAMVVRARIEKLTGAGTILMSRAELAALTSEQWEELFIVASAAAGERKDARIVLYGEAVGGSAAREEELRNIEGGKIFVTELGMEAAFQKFGISGKTAVDLRGQNARRERHPKIKSLRLDERSGLILLALLYVLSEGKEKAVTESPEGELSVRAELRAVLRDYLSQQVVAWAA